MTSRFASAENIEHPGLTFAKSAGKIASIIRADDVIFIA